MRLHGLADRPGGIGLNGHACWGYNSLDGDFAAAAVPFLHEGLDLGQRLAFVGGPEAEKAVRELEPMRSLVDDGTLQVMPFDAIYPGGRRMSNQDQWALYSGATDQAIADGFTGLRVLAEVTSLVGPAEAWLHHVAWEAYADRRMAGRQLAALCCFDRSLTDDDALGSIASAHPVADRRLRPLVPFQLFTNSDGIAVAGEVDSASADLFEQLLTIDDGTTEDVVLDLAELTFIDHHGVVAVQRFADRLRDAGRHLMIRDEPEVFRRLTDLLGVDVASLPPAWE
ncbi:MEDS domain-containing protein [Aeromicrobium terrae]|uniref:STAS domain-containing protein n=1 Tax=Aeromicrobium terrae TaxID=2498846 RepID=A0A5C8NHN6_9ACTN|nr:MEDS domain-containing protein [Aeromicrobium terrae]TXL61394.1 STAS domain-containing protein [Aeromicrobium terrae]